MRQIASHRLLAATGALYRRWARRRALVTRDAALAAARAIVERKKYCVLATRSAQGVHARVLQPWRPDADFTVWLGTSPISRKLAELEACPLASLVYQDDRAQACVVLEGEIDVVREPAVCQARFMPVWRAFFPEGPERGFVALRFTTRRIEVLDFSRHLTPEPFGLRAAGLTRGNDGWVLE